MGGRRASARPVVWLAVLPASDTRVCCAYNVADGGEPGDLASAVDCEGRATLAVLGLDWESPVCRRHAAGVLLAEAADAVADAGAALDVPAVAW